MKTQKLEPRCPCCQELQPVFPEHAYAYENYRICAPISGAESCCCRWDHSKCVPGITLPIEPAAAGEAGPICPNCDSPDLSLECQKCGATFTKADTRPPTAQPLPAGGVDVAMDYPPATGENITGGWIIDFKFLQEVQKDCEMQGSFQLEEIEEVLLAARSRLSRGEGRDAE